MRWMRREEKEEKMKRRIEGNGEEKSLKQQMLGGSEGKKTRKKTKQKILQLKLCISFNRKMIEGGGFSVEAIGF